MAEAAGRERLDDDNLGRGFLAAHWLLDVLERRADRVRHGAARGKQSWPDACLGGLRTRSGTAGARGGEDRMGEVDAVAEGHQAVVGDAGGVEDRRGGQGRRRR